MASPAVGSRRSPWCRVRLASRTDGRFAIGGSLNLVSFGLEVVLERCDERRLVIDYEYPFHGEFRTNYMRRESKGRVGRERFGCLADSGDDYDSSQALDCHRARSSVVRAPDF